MEAAEEQGIELRAVRKTSGSDSEPEHERIVKAGAYPKFFASLGDDCLVGAGTAWLWSRPEAEDTVDVLFVDEAAQMSLANALAISHAAPNMVLLGDPQQLDQPMQGTHPDGTAVSVLERLLDGRQTIDPNSGLFLEETWRLHPEICSFTSDAFYEGKLRSRPGLEGQRIVSSGPLDGAGLRYLPVVHRANQSSSDEEADRVCDLVGKLLEERCDMDRQGRRPKDAHPRRHSDHRAVQRPGLQDTGAAAGREGGYGGQVPGSGGAGGRIFHDDLQPGGRASRHGVPVQPEQA